MHRFYRYSWRIRCVVSIPVRGERCIGNVLAFMEKWISFNPRKGWKMHQVPYSIKTAQISFNPRKGWKMHHNTQNTNAQAENSFNPRKGWKMHRSLAIRSGREIGVSIPVRGERCIVLWFSRHNMTDDRFNPRKGWKMHPGNQRSQGICKTCFNPRKGWKMHPALIWSTDLQERFQSP